MSSNIKPFIPSSDKPKADYDALSIRAYLEKYEVEIGPDPQCDGDWMAVIEYAPPGGRSLPVKLYLVALGASVIAYTEEERGTLSLGRKVRLEGDALLLEGDEGEDD